MCISSDVQDIHGPFLLLSGKSCPLKTVQAECHASRRDEHHENALLQASIRLMDLVPPGRRKLK